MRYHSNFLKVLFIALIVAPLITIPVAASAQTTIFGELQKCLVGVRSSDGNYPKPSSDSALNQEIGVPGSCDVNKILVFANNLIKYIIGISGAVALLMYIVGGVWMIFSTGNPGRISRGKDIIIGTSVSLIFILGGYLIVQFIVNNALNSEIRLNPLGTPKPEESGCCLILMQTGNTQSNCYNNLTRTQCEVKKMEIKGTSTSVTPGVACPSPSAASKCMSVDNK